MSNFNTEAKKIIRSVWCKSLIQFLFETLQSKLVYLGLPSEHPEDIYEWIDYLDVIYAFQCRFYPHPSKEDQSRERVLELESKLRVLERQNKLSTFTVFDGYIEEVVLSGKDNNPQPIQFGHEQTITVYNLDFCNSITSPLEIVVKSEKRTAFKFDAIKELLRYQSQQNQLSKKFLLFLTVRTDFHDPSVRPLIESKHGDYNRQIAQLKGLEKKSRVLKAYVYEILRSTFEMHNFVPEFLPAIRYKGTKDHDLLVFTVVGTFLGPHPGGIVSSQKSRDFLMQAFITPTDSQEFISLPLSIIGETRPKTDAVEAFQKSLTYRRFWVIGASV